MDTVYDHEFWSVIHENADTSSEIPQDLKDPMKNDEECVVLLISLFTRYKGAPKYQLFRLLLECRDDWLTFRIPEYQKDRGAYKYTGLSILHLVLLLKPCKAYLDLLLCTPEMLEVEDADGNGTLFYAIKSNIVSVYERVWKLTNSDGQSAQSPGPQTCSIFFKADCTHVLKAAGGLKHFVDLFNGQDVVFSMALTHNSINILEQTIKAYPSLISLNGLTYIDMLMIDHRVRYTTFRTVLELILSESQSLIEKVTSKYSSEVIGKRLWDLAVTPKFRKNALTASTIFSKKFGVPVNEFVRLTGYTYDQLYLKYCNKSLHSPLSRTPDISSINHISPTEGNYITMIAKAISQGEDVFKTCDMCRCSLNAWYIPQLLKIKEADWTVPDSEGVTPFIYFTMRRSLFDYDTFDKIRKRCSTESTTKSCFGFLG